MPFEFRSTLDQTVRAMRQTREGFPQRRNRALQSMGFYMLAQERKHFGQLVATGSSNGVTWSKPAEATVRRRRALAKRGLLATADPERIGILSGEMAKGFRFRVTRRSVRLINIVPYSNIFGFHRPIYPRTFPADWLQACDNITQRAIDKELQ